jgi:uncharacterized membrane protein
LALPPVLVAAVSLAARRWGATVAGLLLGLPWMTGPVLFFLALDRGDAFAASACVGIELGVVCIAAYMLAYGIVSLFASWPLCLGAAMLGFFGSAWATQELTLPPALKPATELLGHPLYSAAAAAAGSLAVTIMLLPRSRAAALETALPWWDIPMRMLATFCVVSIIILAAGVLGPQLSGIISTFPAIVTVIGSFTHRQWGAEAVRRILRGLARSLFSFVGFFVVVGIAIPKVGLAASFVLAGLVSIFMSAALLMLSRQRLRISSA